MSTVPPPNPALPQMLAAAAANTATIPRPSPEIANLAPGATITGTVVITPSADPKLALLATPKGDVPLRLPTPLPQGSELTIEVVRASPAQVTVRLVALDGQPLQQPKQNPTAEAPQTPQPTGRLPTGPGTPAPLPQGTAWWPGGPQPVTTLPHVSAYVIAGPEPAPAPTPTPQQGAQPQTQQQTSPPRGAMTPTPQPPTATPPAPQAAPAPSSPASQPPPPATLPTANTAPPAPTPQAPTAAAPNTPPPAQPVAPPLQQTAAPASVPQGTVPLPSPPPSAPVQAAPVAALPVPVLAPTGSDLTLRIVSIVLPQGDGPRVAPPQPTALPFAGTLPGVVTTPATPLPTPPIFGAGVSQTAAIPTTPSPVGSPSIAPQAPGVPSAPATAPVTSQIQNAPATAPTTPLPGSQTGAAAPPTPPQMPLTTAMPTPGAVPAAISNIALPNPPTLVLPTRDGWPAPVPTPPTNVVPSPPQGILTGTVVFAQNGIPVVQTAEGQVQLNIRANLPVGTTVTLEVIDQNLPTSTVRTPTPPTPAPALLPLVTTTSGWPALTEAVQILQRTDPAAATQLLNAIPDGGPRTALAVMSLVQALRTGESRQWPGDTNLRALERTGPRGAHLARQLSAEVGELSRQVREPSTDWRALPLPWQSEGRVERIRLVMRDIDSDDESRGRKGGGGTRFLVDLDLSRLGPLQLDGMFRKETRGFDMMIRTRTALSDAMRQDLAGIFANSNAAMNLVGSLSFQVVKKFPDPLAGPAGMADKSGVWA